MERFDFAVIGGGMMGAPCARHLAEAGHSVALIAAPEPKDAATWDGPFGSHFDAARITRRVATGADWSRLSCRSIARYPDLEARSGRSIFRETGALMAGPRSGQMAGFTDAFRAVADTLDDPPERLDAGAVRARFGFDLPADSMASFEARQGGWIDPRAMRDAQQALATRAGARLCPKAATTRQGRVVTLADGTRISAGHVVLATGPHAASDGLLPRVPKMRVWARTVAFARISEAEGERLAGMPTLIWVPEGWDHDLYLLPPVRYPDGRLYLKIGGQTDSPLIASAAEMRDWFRGPGDAAVAVRLMAALRDLMPELQIEAETRGPCAVVWTETGLPYVDAAEDGVTILCGGNGAAAKCGDELGRLGALTASGVGFAREGYTTEFRAVWA